MSRKLWIESKCDRSHPLNVPSRLKVFAMLMAYMDDSGTHDDSPNCVVAGYWGGKNEWRRFERAWNGVLHREGIEEFKANEFWPRMKGGERLKPYQGWSDDRSRAFIIDLLKIIHSSKIYPFGCGVLGVEWEAQPLTFRELITLADSPKKAKSFLVPFQRNIYRAVSYCHPGVTMYFVFDDDRKKPHVKSGILRCYDAIKGGAIEDKSELAVHLGSIEFEDSKKAAPLQAADLLAYEMHKYAKQELKGVEHMRDVYKIALLRMKSIEDFWLFDGPRFERLRKILPKETNDEIESRINSVQYGNGSDFEG